MLLSEFDYLEKKGFLFLKNDIFMPISSLRMSSGYHCSRAFSIWLCFNTHTIPSGKRLP